MAAMSLRLPDELNERLRVAASQDGESINTAIVVAIRDWLDRRDAEHVQQLFEETAVRHARLLERLADA
jgi:predicted transcriptional regulator